MRPYLGALRSLSLSLAVAALAAVGCGPPTGTVSGKVAYNGATLKGGTVVFMDAAGKVYRSEIGQDGTYKIENVPPGQVKVAVDNRFLRTAGQGMVNAPPPDAKGGTQAQADSEAAKQRYVPIPDKYADAETSGLTYTVTAGSQTYDPPLK